MSARVTAAEAQRVLRQLGHDPRTIALVVGVPCLLVTLLTYVFVSSPVFERIGGPLVGIFPLVSMFVVTSITMLRERTGGTLERLMTLPLTKLDLLLGTPARLPSWRSSRRPRSRRSRSGCWDLTSLAQRGA